MPKPAGEARCVVCGREGRQAAKYRCPGCRERYCSVPCYKKHKGRPWSLDDILTEDDEDDRVPLQKLQLLKESEELQGVLLNPHLHTLLLTIDQAKDKSVLMRKYMQEPVFAEFADCCLRIVESEVEEKETPE
ncbi:hypothetical protein Chor_005866 [Crotalus horridus]